MPRAQSGKPEIAGPAAPKESSLPAQTEPVHFDLHLNFDRPAGPCSPAQVPSFLSQANSMQTVDLNGGPRDASTPLGLTFN